MTRNHYFLCLFLTILLHWLILALFAFNILPLETRHPDSLFWFHQGGDNYGYYDQAHSLLTGHIEANQYPLGFPILMIPAFWLIPNALHDDLVVPLSFFWSVIAFPLGQLLLVRLVQEITKKSSIAFAASAVWALLPLVYYFVLGFLWNQRMGEIIATHSTWAQMLSDGPAAFFTLLAAVLFLASRERNYDTLSVMALGSILGFLGMIRFSGLLIAVVIAGLFLLERRWAKTVLLTLVALFCFSPQMLYNRHFFGGLFETGYTSLSFVPEEGLFSATFALDALGLIWKHLGLLTPFLLLGFVLLFLFAIWRLFLLHRIGALLIAGWVLSYLVFYSLYYYSWRGALMRFMIPVEPAFAFLAAFTSWELYQLARMKLFSGFRKGEIGQEETLESE
jgi:hypothetical protein